MKPIHVTLNDQVWLHITVKIDVVVGRPRLENASTAESQRILAAAPVKSVRQLRIRLYPRL